MNALAVGLGGIVGGLCRYIVSLLIGANGVGSFPWATLLINLSGSFLLGLLTYAAIPLLHPRLQLALTTGFLGAYTTFSAFSLETVQLLSERMYGSAALYVAASLAFGLLLAWIGSILGDRIRLRQFDRPDRGGERHD